jgi:hypothetical protein
MTDPDRPTDSTPDDEGNEDEDGDGDAVDRSTVTTADAGETEPAEPTWEKPDVDDIPEFEIGGRPATGGEANAATAPDGEPDPTAGRPNDARTPASSRLDEGATDAYVAALELCARLPDDVRLPDEAADLVPVAFEAELERNIQAFAASEFDNPTPHVEAMEFFEAEGDVWLKFRLGAPAETFDDLADRTGELRRYALQELDSLF